MFPSLQAYFFNSLNRGKYDNAWEFPQPSVKDGSTEIHMCIDTQSFVYTSLSPVKIKLKPRYKPKHLFSHAPDNVAVCAR